ncbi:MAG: universal stress protein [Myxococcales bacterium]|nr:universal stress protein [Myxococcales bacterium]
MEGQRILVATDLSSQAVPAARWAHDAGRRLGLPVVVVHVIELDMAEWLADRADFAISEAELIEAHRRVEDWYHVATGIRPSRVDARVGGFVTEMQSAARAHDAAMLVMNRTGKSRVTQVLVGSRVQHLASRPPCPLVVVHPAHDSLGEEGPIIAATDFSPAGRAAGRFGAQIALRLGARFELINAVRVPHFPALGTIDGLRLAQVTEFAEASLTRELEMVLRDLPGVDGHAISRQGDPVDVLIEHDTQHQGRLLVLGQTGYMLKLAELLGSVARGVIHHLPGTVCIVPPVRPDSAGDADELAA